MFQINGDHALILEQGGNFKRIRAKKSWAVGDTVPMGFMNSTRGVRYWAAQAAGILLMLFTIQFGVNYYCGQPVTYISLDVNPSIEIAVNRLDMVISVSSYNEDGARVLGDMNLSGKKYSDAIQALMETEGMRPYLENDPFVMVAVSSDANREIEMANQLNTVIGNLDTPDNDFDFLCSIVEWELVEKAHELGTTVGRLALYEQMDEDSGLTMEEFLDSPVSAVMKLLESGAKKGEDASKP